MTPSETEAALRRFERDGLVACVIMTCVTLAVSGGRLDVAGGVLAGGALTALSYLAIKGGVSALARAAPLARTGNPYFQPRPPSHAEAPDSPPSAATDDAGAVAPGRPGSLLKAVFTVVKYFTRYALLAVGAYVMLTCFHLHPAGLLVGALTPFLAALGQLVHMSRVPSGGKHLV